MLYDLDDVSKEAVKSKSYAHPYSHLFVVSSSKHFGNMVVVVVAELTNHIWVFSGESDLKGYCRLLKDVGGSNHSGLVKLCYIYLADTFVQSDSQYIDQPCGYKKCKNHAIPSTS